MSSKNQLIENIFAGLDLHSYGCSGRRKHQQNASFCKHFFDTFLKDKEPIAIEMTLSQITDYYNIEDMFDNVDNTIDIVEHLSSDSVIVGISRNRDILIYPTKKLTNPNYTTENEVGMQFFSKLAECLKEHQIVREKRDKFFREISAQFSKGLVFCLNSASRMGYSAWTSERAFCGLFCVEDSNCVEFDYHKFQNLGELVVNLAEIHCSTDFGMPFVGSYSTKIPYSTFMEYIKKGELVQCTSKWQLEGILFDHIRDSYNYPSKYDLRGIRDNMYQISYQSNLYTSPSIYEQITDEKTDEDIYKDIENAVKNYIKYIKPTFKAKKHFVRDFPKINLDDK